MKYGIKNIVQKRERLIICKKCRGICIGKKTEEQFKDVQYPNKKEGTKGTHLVIKVDILNVFWLEIISMYLILPNITHKKHKDSSP